MHLLYISTDAKYEEELSFYRKIPNPSDPPPDGFTKERFTPEMSSRNGGEYSDNNVDIDAFSGATDNKKTLTAREAVRLFAKLIAEEKAKKMDASSGGMTNGDREVAALHAEEKSSSVDLSKIRPFGEPGVIGEIDLHVHA